VSFAAAISEHPVPASAIGEVTGDVLERLGRYPDLAVLFVTPPHAGALEDLAGAVRAVLEPTVTIGCAAVSVLGMDHEVEEAPAVSLWAGRFGPVAGLRLTDPSDWPAELPFAAEAALVIADPFSFPVDDLLARTELPLIGGMASAARGPGGNRLVLDGQIHTDGAVAALLGRGAGVETIVSQGCRPIGMPLVVTRAERNVIYELAGQPALERLVGMARAGMSERDIKLINQGLHVGLVIDEHKATFGRGDFLVRNVLGADQANGAIAVGEIVEVGTTVQFHVRDAESADEDLRLLVGGRGADAALLFTCNGRGIRLFGTPHHDAGVVSDALGNKPLAGFFAAGELGPIGGRNFLHGFTASIALFHEGQPSIQPSI
jgi:small ligand-binding sensory domain FIST